MKKIKLITIILLALTIYSKSTLATVIPGPPPCQNKSDGKYKFNSKEFYCKNGQKDGIETYLRGDGVLYKSNYEKGKLNGNSTRHDRNGNLIMFDKYDNNKSSRVCVGIKRCASHNPALKNVNNKDIIFNIAQKLENFPQSIRTCWSIMGRNKKPSSIKEMREKKCLGRDIKLNQDNWVLHFEDPIYYSMSVNSSHITKNLCADLRDVLKTDFTNGKIKCSPENITLKLDVWKEDPNR
jgi:hypothetical protein